MTTWLAATLPVLDLALASVGAVVDAARAAGATGPVVTEPIEPERVVASFGSDRLLRIGGDPVDGFAPLSGFFRTADGWVRTHANYPHHRERLTAALGVAADRDAVVAALASLQAQQVEDRVTAAGGIAVRVRDEAEWGASEQGRAAASGPLVRTVVRADTAAARHPLPGGPQPLAGVRVLDLTRVIAGPVATRTLALLGADVLRVDPPQPAELPWQHLDTGQGKRTAVVDGRADLDRLQRLLDAADVLVSGYRPGSVEGLGLRLPPGAVHARINAWGDDGPWAGRRGFDSIVQAASGIAMLESRDGTTPGALPAQALDHATGYLLAGGVIEALTARGEDGRGRDVVAALARTACWLLAAPGRDPGHPPAATPGVAAVVTHGQVTSARPALPGVDDYPTPAWDWGSDPARW